MRIARFRARRAEVAEGLARLLGPRDAVAPLDDPAAVATVEAELLASHREAEPNDWALVRREWRAEAVADCADTLHRLAANLGPRAVWLVVPGREPQAVPISSDLVLDNPLGFAALVESADAELRLLDREVAAGLWLVRQGTYVGAVVAHSWELDVWGEPWLSAATRALRGVGGT